MWCQGILYVIDFGECRVLMAGQKLTVGVGSYAYLSPEEHNESEYGPSADVYAAGVSIFELCFGFLPFTTQHHVTQL